MKFTRFSPLTGQPTTLDLPIAEWQYQAWLEREGMIQDLMPELTPAQREFLISGYTEEDWAKAFPPEEC